MMNTYYASDIKEKERDFYKYEISNLNASQKISLATLSMVLCFSPALASPVFEVNSEDEIQSESRDLISPNKSLIKLNFNNESLEDAKLSVTKTADDIKQDEVLRRFDISFLNNNMTEADRAYFYPVYKQLSEMLKHLPVMGEHVSISRMDGTVMFNLLLPGNLLLTVSKAAYQMQKTDNVMFSISVNRKMMVVDRMPIDELIKRIENTLKEIV